jgi:opacity protein-like surface antigen
MIQNTLKLTSTCLVAAFLCAAISNPTDATVLDKVYLKAGIGGMVYNKFKTTGEENEGYHKKASKTSPIYNFGVGYRFTDSIRADLNIQYASIKYRVGLEDGGYSKQNIKTISSFVNGYYDINFHKNIVPYLTAGVGFGRNKLGNLIIGDEDGAEDTGIGKTKTNFVWNVGLGTMFKFNKNFALDFGYRYMDFGTTKTNNGPGLDNAGGKQKLRGHQVLSSLIFSF